MFGDLLGYFERHHFLGKTAVDTFWATFGKNWATLNCTTSGHTGKNTNEGQNEDLDALTRFIEKNPTSWVKSSS